VFCRLYDEGLIYRGNYIVNWCPRCQTALSDEESEHVETQGNLWYIRYPVGTALRAVRGGFGETALPDFLVVATTRPETMLGDTAVAVNPKDERYASLIGKTVMLPLMNREIPVVADDYVDREFGTGVVKITPAHDPNDFQVAQRHNLPPLNVMNNDGTMNAEAGVYAGMDRFACRKQVVADLEAQGFLVKVEPHQLSVGHCYRCDTVVEPRLSKQWFVKMKPLAAPAIEAVRSGKIVFTPQRWEKTYFEWMENIRDWCISRQIWWGHRIPVYTCSACGHEWATKATPTVCPHCQLSIANCQFTQDPDVLDTWFSSWLWPFSTFGWPHENPDLKFYYPTNDLTTAPDIIFFWVARMIMAGCKFMGDVPFRNVYIHGTVRDDKGRKMSKSLGNSIDPLDIITKYSADSLRFSLMLITSTGMDVYVNMEKFEIGRNFATKIWNAARFMKMHIEKSDVKSQMSEVATSGFSPLTSDLCLLTSEDRHLLDTLDTTITAMTEHLGKFRLQDGALAIYDFVWTTFCDWYLEYAKQDLYGTDDARRSHVLSVMTDVFSKSLKLLHPYMPFLTEELWHQMGYAQSSVVGVIGVVEELKTKNCKLKTDFIMHAPWPAPYSTEQRAAWGLNAETTAYVTAKRELVTAGRALRAEYNVPPSQFVKYVLQATDIATLKRLEADTDSLKQQLRAETIELTCDQGGTDIPVCSLCKLGTIYLPLEGLVDTQAEAARVKAELKKMQGFLNGVNAKLSNENFVSKAPPAVIEQQRAKQKELTETIERLEKLHKMFAG
jgi:valyl-tRNA synthetase